MDHFFDLEIGQTVVINDIIKVSLVGKKTISTIYLGLDAPKDVVFVRGELHAKNVTSAAWKEHHQ